MFKLVFSFITVAFLYLTTIGQNSNDPILLKVNSEEVRLSEFEAVYNKNNANAQAIDPKSKTEYLDLYINFKLKVAEAEQLGMDTSKKFVNELAGYRRQLAAPYLTDQTVTESLIREAYDRSKFDINAYHILVQVDENASAKDTLKALKKINALRKKVKVPANDFEKIARTSSEDPSAVNNGGDLGYFSSFQMVYPFETAAFNTPVGSVSEPIRTRFGYHLVYVKDKRPARGEIRASHIMVKIENEGDMEDINFTKLKIDEIYEKLKAGEKFESLAREFSDDKGSASNGGELPWFGTGRMVPAFENAAFGLKKDGDFSEPVRSRFGWHIIKRLEVKKTPEFEEIEDELKKKVTRDGRGKKSKSSFYNKIKKEYNYKFNEKNFKAMNKTIDDNYFSQKWIASEKAKGMDKVIFTLEDTKHVPAIKTVTQADFADFMEKNKKYQRTPKLDAGLITNLLFKDFLNQSLTLFEDARLEKKYPDFGALMQEYHDGILLFDLMDQKVWSMAVKDTTGLKKFYEANKTNYMWPDRLDATLYSCADKKLAKKTYKTAKKMMKKSTYNEDSLLALINAESQLNLTIEDSKFEKGENDFIDQLDWSKEGFTKITESNGKYRFTYIKEFLPAVPKQLDEAKGIFISAYQDQLEEDWLKELKSKYKVEVYKEVLK